MRDRAVLSSPRIACALLGGLIGLAGSAAACGASIEELASAAAQDLP